MLHSVRYVSLRRFALPVALLLVLAACSGSGSASVAATVDGTDIPVSEVEDSFNTFTESPEVATQLEADESGDFERTAQAQVLTDLIRTQLLQVAAEDLDLEITDEELAEERANLVESTGGEEALQTALDNAGISEDELDRRLTDRLIQTKIGEMQDEGVSDEEVRDAFEADEQGLYGEQAEVRHILVETEEQAQAAIDRIQGGEDFGAVAQELSQDPGSAENGGELGQVARGQTVPEFEEAAFDSEIGELVGPVETQFGFHVMEVTDRVAGPAFEDVEEDLRAQLEGPAREEAFNTYLQDLLERIEVEVNPQFGTWDNESIQVVVEDPLGSESPAQAPEDGQAPAPTEPAPAATQ